jgi:hypothetical protein
VGRRLVRWNDVPVRARNRRERMVWRTELADSCAVRRTLIDAETGEILDDVTRVEGEVPSLRLPRSQPRVPGSPESEPRATT